MDNKAQIIQAYIQNFDFTSDWSISRIKSDLRQFLGEEPAVNVNFIKDAVLNEVNSEAIEIKKIDTISISYSPNLDYTIETLTYKISNNGRI